ncbi:polysaccharide deacetylase family protein [Microbacterium allomyrinae]|uniref:Polysaccharide deacetylase family protein n=1 Tax=Microbacterium allomyrinae TaxID=2830666 RepID=A0A9X1S3Z4_9MICO|nr:polysaccharide deacetylase family protein [Microbacterium allomyrinae]MCC2033027.1 polysaccharide deacetylase family protein [Microbacterium allomyrinae]
MNAVSGRGRIMTLCFHGIGRPQRELEAGEERFWIERHRFAQILAAVNEHEREVELTFDDANVSDYDEGLPALVRHGLRARFFIITDRIDRPGSLSGEQIARMRTAGMTFGIHGATHLPWPMLAARGQLDAELDAAAGRLEPLVGDAVDHAAFPQGQYDRAVIRTLKDRRFVRAYSVDEGWSSRRAWLRTRYSVIRSDTPESVVALLENPHATTDPWPIRPMKQAAKRWR